MASCSSTFGLLILVLTTFSTGSVSAVPSVKVELHGSATLLCSERCSGLVRWTEFSKHTDTLAECDQTSCRSVKEGYQMIHHQYLNGDLSLTITEVDFSKRSWYTCDCDGKDLCDVQLLIEPLNTTVHLKPGEPLLLDLDLSDPVEVLYNSTGVAGLSSGQICTVDGHQLQCSPEYEERVSAALQLKGVNLSDSGVYNIQDSRTKEIIHTFTVSVRDDLLNPDKPVSRERQWGLVVVLGLLLVSCVVNVWLWREKRRLQKNTALKDGGNRQLTEDPVI